MDIENIVRGLKIIEPSEIRVDDAILVVSEEEQNISINQFVVEVKPYFDFVDTAQYIEYGDKVLDLRNTSIYLVSRPITEEPKELGSTVWFESEDDRFVLVKTANLDTLLGGTWSVFRYIAPENIIPSFWKSRAWVSWAMISDKNLHKYEWGQKL